MRTKGLTKTKVRGECTQTPKTEGFCVDSAPSKSPLDLDKLERLEKAATPGPWTAGRSDMATIVDGVDSKWIYAGEQYCAVASGRIDGEWDEVMANANLITSLRNAAPELIARARRLEELERELAQDEANAVELERIAEYVRKVSPGAHSVYEVLDRAKRLERIEAAAKMAVVHLEEMRKDPHWHPVGDCPVLNELRAALEESR